MSEYLTAEEWYDLWDLCTHKSAIYVKNFVELRVSKCQI